MGNWTYNEFKEYLQFQFGDNADLTAAVLQHTGATDIYGILFNTAYRDITTRHKFWDLKKRFYFPELEDSTTKTTTDGTAYVTAPTGCLFVQEIYDTTNNVHLNYRPWSWYVAKTDRSDTSNESNPKYWTPRASSGTKNLYLYPTPDTTNESLTVYYRKCITELSTGTSTTEIGEEWDEPILLLAAIKGNMWMNDWEKVGRLKDEWKDMVQDRLEIYTPAELARREHIRIHPAYHIR